MFLLTTAPRAIALVLAGALLTSCADAPPLATKAPTGPAGDRASADAAKPAIVLVHGAWADGSGWAGVMRALQRRGYRVTAVQNPLQSSAGDVANTRRVIDAQGGPTVVVGHSYGGAVVTGAAAGAAHVKALVYVAAFAPDAGEVFAQLIGRFGPGELDAALRPDAAGYLYLDRALFHDVFASGLPRAESDVLAAVQKPVNSSVFAESLPAAAWKTIPAWYLVATQDHTIKPELQRFMATRMGATVREFRAGHLVFISHPEVVVRMIEDAVAATAD